MHFPKGGALGTIEPNTYLHEEPRVPFDQGSRLQKKGRTSAILRMLAVRLSATAPADSTVLLIGKPEPPNTPGSPALRRPTDANPQVSTSLNCAALHARLDCYSLLLNEVFSGNREVSKPNPIPARKSNASLGKKVKKMHSKNGRTNPDTGSPSKIELISHALDNLLCVINSNADILADKLDPDHGAHRHISQIKKAIKTAGDLVCQLRAA